MRFEDCPAGENILYLERSIELIDRLDDGVYAGGPQGQFRGGVGGQFRHCIDFYERFLAGYAEGRVDYSRRERDTRLETDRKHAIRCLRGLVVALRRIDRGCVGDELDVRSDDASLEDDTLCWSRSTVLRELHFLLSHTIHHHALIIALLDKQGVDPGDEFAELGVAPSTANHWKEAGTIAT